MNPIIGIAQFANEYHTAVVSLKDINGLLQYPDQKQGDGEEVTTVNNISLEEMSFSYTESNKKVFEPAQFEVRKRHSLRSSWKKWTRQKHSVQNYNRCVSTDKKEK